MSLPRSYPDVRGMRMSFSSVTIKIAGQSPLIACKDISYDDTLAGVKVKGTNPYPLGRTRGDYEANGSIEIYREEFNDLMQTLVGFQGFKEQAFNIVVQYSENGTDVITDTLVGCRIESNPSKASQSADPLTIAVKLSVMHILWDQRHSIEKIPGSLISALF